MTREKLIALRDAQAEKTRIDDIVKDARSKFEKAIETNVSRQKDLDKTISELKADLEAEAKADFAADPEKKKARDGGIKIQQGTTMSYDAVKAFEFAKEKDMFLQLDKKAFEKAAPGLGLKFVINTQTVKVSFPTAGVVVEDEV